MFNEVPPSHINNNRIEPFEEKISAMLRILFEEADHPCMSMANGAPSVSPFGNIELDMSSSEVFVVRMNDLQEKRSFLMVGGVNNFRIKKSLTSE